MSNTDSKSNSTNEERDLEATIQEMPQNNFIKAEELVELLPEDERGEIPGRIDSTEDSLEDEDLEEEAELSYEEGLEDGLNSKDVEEFQSYKNDIIIEKREDTRSRLAFVYIIATFIVFILGMAIAVIDGIIRQVSIIDNLSEVIPLISGVFLGSLGFVLGYYFRRGDEDK